MTLEEKWKWDGVGRLTSEETWGDEAGGGSGARIVTRTLAYDGLGRVTEETFEYPQAETGFAPDQKKTFKSYYDVGNEKDPTFRRKVVFPDNYRAGDGGAFRVHLRARWKGLFGSHDHPGGRPVYFPGLGVLVV